MSSKDKFRTLHSGINVTRKMRIALLMISEDSQYVCKWQTIVRLTEAGYISYIDGRACITPMGRELLASPSRTSLSHKDIAFT